MLAVAVACLALWLSPAPEPAYNGRLLSEWLNDLIATNRQPDAVAAVRAIGTNAVPHLLRGFDYSYSPRRELLYRTSSRVFHDTLHLATQPIYDPAQLRYLGAVRGFEALGATASNAVPSLRRLLDTPTGDGAAIALSYIGPAALPAFTETLGNGSATGRCHALVGVAHLGTNAGPALSAVLSCLNDTNLNIRNYAIAALGQMRGEAASAVPALTRLLDDPDAGVRALTVQSLRYIGTQRVP